MLLKRMVFRVSGVTFKNEEGKDIQKEIIKVLNEYKANNYFDELYGGYTNSEIKEMDLNVCQYEGYKFPAKIAGDEYNGENCFKIYFKTYNDDYIHIGYAPKKNLEELTEWLTKENVKVKGNLSIVGGKYKYCELYEEDYEEKERVAIKELTYGIEIQLDFYDNDNETTLTQILERYGETLPDEQYTTQKEMQHQSNNIDNLEVTVYIVFIIIGIIAFMMLYFAIDWLLN